MLVIGSLWDVTALHTPTSISNVNHVYSLFFSFIKYFLTPYLMLNYFICSFFRIYFLSSLMWPSSPFFPLDNCSHFVALYFPFCFYFFGFYISCAVYLRVTPALLAFFPLFLPASLSGARIISPPGIVSHFLHVSFLSVVDALLCALLFYCLFS